MPEITPDDVARRDFRSSFRGYDAEEVRSFLRTVADGLQALVEDRDRLRAEYESIGSPDLKAEIAQVGRDVAGVLEEARQVAQSMRERASAESARWRSEAVAECESELRGARADAEQLRSDAWSTAEELLAQSQRESARQVDEAKAEALRLMGEAERESHKITAAARRQADEMVRVARMESERLTIDAKARHDEIIQTASRQAETAQERTRALEQRRDELKRELETVRQALASMESAMDERRERLGLSAAAAASEPAPEAEEEAEAIKTWTPGETVRVVRPEPGSTPAESGPTIYRLDESPEIRLITAEELHRLRGEGEEPPEEALADEVPGKVDEREVSTEEAVPDMETPAGDESEGEAIPDEDEVAVEETVVESVEETIEVESAEPAPEESALGHVVFPNDEARQQSFDDLVGLFDRLRSDKVEPGESAGGDDAGRSTAVEAPAGTETTSESTAERSRRPVVGDPFEIRDQLLLPVSNRALRNLKRQLAEEGNVALEELHLQSETWAPRVEEVATKVRADLVVLHTESFGAGHAAAERLTGQRLSRPSTPRVDVASGFAGDLVADIEHALEEGRSAGQGALQLKATVARVFRAWRTDESERRMRALSLAAFNVGLSETMRVNDLEGLAWVVAGRGCAVCRSLAESPVDDRLPPAHDGCECVVVPG